MQNESNIWDQLRNGQESALKTIYDKYFDTLINYGMRMSLHHELVEDSVQELFIDIWNLKANLSPTDNIKNYLICSYRRKLIRNLKQKSNLAEESSIDHSNAVEPSFLNQLVENELTQSRNLKLAQAMEQLSSRQKEAIFLKFHEGLDYDTICEAMDLKYQSVRNLISTGIARMKEYVGFILAFYISIEYIAKILDLINWRNYV